MFTAEEWNVAAGCAESALSDLICARTLIRKNESGKKGQTEVRDRFNQQGELTEWATADGKAFATK